MAGRPRKEPLVINKIEETQEVNLSHTALGVFKDSKSGEWILARIKYDPISGTVGEIEEEIADLQMYAREKFKIAAAHEVLDRSE